MKKDSTNQNEVPENDKTAGRKIKRHLVSVDIPFTANVETVKQVLDLFEFDAQLPPLSDIGRFVFTITVVPGKGDKADV